MLPDISVIIPVYNEKDTAEVVENLFLSALGTTIQVVVIDGDPERSSCKQIQREEVLQLTSPLGRAVQMNTGAKHATAPILLFLHADTTLPEGWPESIRKSLGVKKSAGAFRLGIDATGMLFRIIEAGTVIRCFLSGIPYGDQAIFIRSNVFREIGGFRELPILEDVDIMKRLKLQGHRIVMVNKSVLTSARRWLREGILLRSFRNRLIMLMYYLGVPPTTLKKIYYNNRLQHE